MKERPLRATALASYVARLRDDPNDVYAALRVQQRGQTCDLDRATKKAAMRALLRHDPWFMADPMAWFPDATFTIAEATALEPLVGRGLPAGTAAWLRAFFWLRAFRRSESRQAVARRALAHLRRVPAALRVVDWHEMVYDSHRRAGDFAGSRRAFPKLFLATDPEWRAHPLRSLLRDAAAKREWRTYDRWRPQWDRLPANRHSCECATNDVATCDGLRALAARRLDELPRHLAAAADVRGGCAHLNSGGMRLDLVRTMVARRLHLDACRTYLEHAARFRVTSDLAALQQRVADAVAHGRVRRAGSRRSRARP